MTTVHEALRQCVEAMKEVDFADCGKDDARWHKLNAAQQVAEEVLKAGEPFPYAYAYEYVQPGTDGKGWAQFINRDPVMPKDGVRNIIPLYAAPVAPQQAVAVPSDWQLVPKKPNAQMILAAEKADDEGFEAGRSHGASPYEIYDAMLAAAPQPAAAPSGDAIRELIALHSDELEQNDYAYFELARTRRTGWMAWICTNLIDNDPGRKVLATGQGSTPDEACEAAIQDYKGRASVQCDRRG